MGGGDAFAGGLLHGILEEMQPQAIIDFATAALCALKHTIHGDCNQFNQAEVASLSLAVLEKSFDKGDLSTCKKWKHVIHIASEDIRHYSTEQLRNEFLVESICSRENQSYLYAQ